MAVNKLPQAFDVEPMRLGDVDAVMEIERVSFRSPMVGAGAARGDGARVGPHRRRARSRRGAPCVAFGNYWLVADEVHLLNLATHPEARRAGHASRLLAHIIEVGPRADAAGSSRSRCGARTPAALRLYRRFGFRPVGVRPNYYAEDQEDAIVMLLDLA